MRASFLVAIAAFIAALMFGSSALAESETADVTPPTVVALTLDKYAIYTGVEDALITATLHITDDLSGVSVAYLRMRPLEVLRLPAPEYQYSIGGSCTFEQGQIDTICIIPMTVMQYAYEGEWAVESIIAEDKLRNSRKLFHPELPGEWNTETGEVIRYYCEMYENECLPPHLIGTFVNEPPPTCGLAIVPTGTRNKHGEWASCDPYELMLPLIAKQ